jgi:transcriptional regulator with XRE-family HTH domain
MDFEEWVALEEARDPAFRQARQETRPAFESGMAILSARLEAGLTQAQLAERAGMKQSAIARLERGDRTPSIETIARLAVALSVEFLITSDGRLAVHRREAA